VLFLKRHKTPNHLYLLFFFFSVATNVERWRFFGAPNSLRNFHRESRSLCRSEIISIPTPRANEKNCATSLFCVNERSFRRYNEIIQRGRLKRFPICVRLPRFRKFVTKARTRIDVGNKFCAAINLMFWFCFDGDTPFSSYDTHFETQNTVLKQAFNLLLLLLLLNRVRFGLGDFQPERKFYSFERLKKWKKFG